MGSANVIPSDLAAVIDAWTDLPEAVRAGIVAMVRAALARLMPIVEGYAAGASAI